jgi:hypothetical protein
MNMMGGMGFGGQMPGFSGGGSGGMMQGQMMGDANMQMMYNQVIVKPLHDMVN